MRVVLISTYDLGRQPFGLASPAAWLREDGHEVTTADLSREPLQECAIRSADWIAFHLPMHTATRLAVPRISAARLLNPSAVICCYGLYAAMNAELLQSIGVAHIISGEFERELADVIGGRRQKAAALVLDRLDFRPPDRSTLPALTRYAMLVNNEQRRAVGYTEASRGCKHLCAHCPVVPVYNGRFRVVPRETVLADIRQQVAAGAGHITFGDPDFLNGPGHARAVVEALHTEFPQLTYDVTIKVEHLLRRRDFLPTLARTGCLFVTTAVESLNDSILARLRKGHTRADFFECVRVGREEGITLAPTFVPFTPWTAREDYVDLLRSICDLGLVANVAPVQFAIRLLIPAGSRLLERTDLPLDGFDRDALSWRWRHPDAGMDALCDDVRGIVRDGERVGASRAEIFAGIRTRTLGETPDFHLPDRATIPYLTEPWYC